jgi:hypothetical protein
MPSFTLLAKHSSSFADVTKETGILINGTFGKEKENTWHPWKYEDRMKVVKVEKLKKKVDKEQLSESTKRNKITSLIGKCCSRKQFPPPTWP